MYALQSLAFETLEPLGPELSALLSGFAVILFGQLYATPAGEMYAHYNATPISHEDTEQ